MLAQFSHFSMKTYVVGTHKKGIRVVLLKSTDNIDFYGEIGKIRVFFV